jgi:hypothetical protein
MPINVQCQSCGGRFQAPDKLAGKRVKCPRCSGEIAVAGTAPKPPSEKIADEISTPAPLAPEAPRSLPNAWYVLTTDEEQLGPLSKSELDSLVSQGRLDAFCRVRQDEWQQWRWMEDVFPELAGGGEAEAGGDPQRLGPCPDCGQMVSRRAGQCPHCGCPVAEASKRPPLGVGVRLSGAGAVPSDGRRARRRKKFIAIGAGSAALVLGFAAFGVWWVLRTVQEVPDALIREIVEDPTPVAPPPRADEGTFDDWATEASAAMAKKIDALQRKAYAATAMLTQARANVDLLKALAEPDPFRQKSNEKDPTLEAPAEPEPYESQYEPLCEECLKYIRDNVSPEGADRDAVWEAAQRWADTKQAPLEDQLEKQLQDQLGL